MKKRTAAKWIVIATAATVTAAFTTGVIYELKRIKRLTADADSAEEPKAEDVAAEVTESEEA
ncbi:MAG: hypothetical protein IJW92_03400 [Clostridia bacterium]|nr:hypothetical protein [Clostridia bacterium]